jgi:GNAT superfamily N-acetyltransferase
VTIRLATADDAPVVRELFRESMLQGQLRGNDTGADVDNLIEGYFSDHGASGFWVACYRDQIIGMIGAQKTGESTAELRRLRVREGFRRAGVGTRLIEHAVDFCRQRGYLKIVLDVRIERAPALAILQKCGFTHSRTREIDGRKTLDFYMNLYSHPQG